MKEAKIQLVQKKMKKFMKYKFNFVKALMRNSLHTDKLYGLQLSDKLFQESSRVPNPKKIKSGPQPQK